MTTDRRAEREIRRRPLGVLVALLVTLALVAAACGGGGDDSADEGDENNTTTTDAGPPQMGGKIVYALSAETDGWDPSTSRWSPSGLVVANAIFDTLTRFNEDGEIEPYLAESLTPNDDYTEWTIKLRPDVTFHNDEPLNAAAVIKNIEFHVNSPLTGAIFDQIESAEPVEGDDLSLIVHTKEPFWNLPVALSTQIGVVAAPAMLDSEDRARNPVGTGPFMFEEWTPDASLTVVRNPNYWQTDEDGNQLPYLDEIEFQPIIDPTTRASALQAGNVDVAQMNEPVALTSFEGEDSGFQIFTDPDSEQDEVFAMLNTSQPPFDSEVARQALAYATNREVVSETIGDGIWEPAEGPFRETSSWYTDVEYPDYDAAKAAELVQQYEEETGEPLSFTIQTSPSSFALEIAQFLGQMWGESGIQVEIESLETSQLIAGVITGNYESALWYQFGSAHPLLESVWWHCDFVSDAGEIGLNFARNCNEELTQALDDARVDDDPANQKGYYDIVQEQLAADLPYIWLMHSDVAIVARDGVVSVFDYALPSGSKGLPINNGAHPLQQVWLTSSG
jgi:ABC-type transport system substrate-binding protein